jgi:hypothetical protein
MDQVSRNYFPVQRGGLANRLMSPVWQTEEWLQTHAKPLDQSGGKGVEAPLPPGREQADVAME